MAQVTDVSLSNQAFGTFRSELNNILEAINTSNSGTSRPSSAVAGTVWLDTTSATTPTLKFFDGTDDISLAQLDYSANTVNWLDSTVTISPLTTDLDVGGNAIVSSSNGNITFTPDGTGKVIIDGLSYPTADGTNGQALITNGSGILSFGDVSGGTDWQSSIKTANFTAVAGEGYWINTTSSAVTMTLPASASVGDTIEFVDYARNWGTNNVTINPNSLNFQGNSSPNPVYDVSGQSVRIVYSGATQGWIPTVDDDVTLETPQTYTADFLVIAGGGGGSGDAGAGGSGSGGYRNSYSTESSGGGGSSETSLSLTPGTTYTITVGAGGTACPTNSGLGGQGGDSSISGSDITDITSAGGGVGGSGGGGDNDGTVGGCGGGADDGTGSSGTANQGFKGGDSPGGDSSGGGGGAGAVGVSSPGSNVAGDGGAGLSSSITGSSVTRGGGGGGATFNASQASGGTGGGGDGGTQSPVRQGSSGTANTGGGAGGKYASAPHNSGGSGVVILRMATSDYSGTTSGSPTVTTDGADTILTFNASGSYTA